jgi:hypothetical protein
MAQKINKFLYWTPRILAIIFILFLAVFSLDIFEMKLGFWGTIAGLFMHNIPVFILLIILLISWRREIVGGLVFTLSGILYILMILTHMLRGLFEWQSLAYSLIIAGPALIIGILFIIGWFKKKDNHQNIN